MTSPELTGRTLVIGPGWLGAPLARRLADLDDSVYTLQRSAPPQAAIRTTSQNSLSVVALSGDIARAADGDMELSALKALLPSSLDHLIICIAPSRARGDDYNVYPRAAHGAAALAVAMEIPHVLYVSSTGVYDRHDGGEVTERSVIEPNDARVQALYDAERAIAAAANGGGRTVHILRAAGLYGPQRDPAMRLANPAFGATDVWCNFSWRDDVITAIAHLGTHDLEPGARIFNCADGTPLRSSEIVETVTGRPSVGMFTQTGDSANAPVRSGRSNQRINVAALLATGWRPTAPTVFDGLRMLGHTLPLRGATS